MKELEQISIMSFRISSGFSKKLSFFLTLIKVQSTVYTLMKHFSNCLNTFQLLKGVKLSVSYCLIGKEASLVR